MSRWLADTRAIAVITGRKPATIRSWAFRGKLRRYGYDEHGRALYDVEEAERLAATQGALENSATMCNTESSAGDCPQQGGPLAHWPCLPPSDPAGTAGGHQARSSSPADAGPDACQSDLQRLHAALAPWLTTTGGDDGRTAIQGH